MQESHLVEAQWKGPHPSKTGELPQLEAPMELAGLALAEAGMQMQTGHQCQWQPVACLEMDCALMLGPHPLLLQEESQLRSLLG